ncbi:MAG: phosphoribosyltransferase [Longispora sp.]|nr:phosphoribosyltransferase [Longispora sp. (in: high G+C Gram-positive bacteria)]
MSEQMNTALGLLSQIGAVLTNDHLVYTSGRHGSAYLNKDAIYPHTAITSRLCAGIAAWFSPHDVDAVIAPAVGGVILSQWTAHHLSATRDQEVLGLYADKVGEEFVIKRGYDRYIPGKNILVVEDVLTTGGSVRKVIDGVRELGGTVVGVGALCNRGAVTPTDLGDVPELFASVTVDFESWEAEECPLCKKGMPVNTSVGKGLEFLAARAGSSR